MTPCAAPCSPGRPTGASPSLLPGSALNARPLGEDLYLLVLPAHWTLPGSWQRPYIHLGDPHDRCVADALARHGVRVRPALSLDSEAAIAAMVAGELGSRCCRASRCLNCRRAS